MLFNKMTDKNEIITLSSDEEEEFENLPQLAQKAFLATSYMSENNVHCFQKNSNTKSPVPLILRKNIEHFQSGIENIGETNKEEKEIVDIIDETSSTLVNKISFHQSPEVVDLVECKEIQQEETIVSLESGVIKSTESQHMPAALTTSSSSTPKKNLNSSMITYKKKVNKDYGKNERENENAEDLKSNSVSENVNSENKINDSLHKDVICEKLEHNIDSPCIVEIEEINSKNKFYNEFVNLCMSLEEIPTDRSRLSKKLFKRYQEASPEYIESEEFKKFIEKCKNKLQSKNLYLIAKEVTDELCCRKKIECRAKKFSSTEKKDEKKENKIDFKNVSCTKKKQTKIINKILKKLDLLGMKIRELEEAEVDLSDEEESSYIQLQRYRYRFCLIYKKLCEYTNEISDANRVYSRKICFSGSKNQEINKCIENWLNKTKRFPDFSDIVKLLESQNSCPKMSTNQDSIRAIAVEVFQQVGVMLQQRRKYDLWDSFGGFLNDSEDPANKDPELDRILRTNFENRVKKEQEIFAYYAKIQDSQQLQPEEVPDDVACLSPQESGNEDEKEIEEIEKSINEKLDVVIKKEHFVNESSKKENLVYLDDSCSSSVEEGVCNEIRVELSTSIKESKNNYKNCKSLKWREGTKIKVLHEGDNDEISSPPEEEMKKAKNLKFKNTKQADVYLPEIKEKNETHKTDKEDSDVEYLSTASSDAAKKNLKLLKSIKKPLIKIERISNSIKPGAIKPYSIKRVLNHNVSQENDLSNPKKSKIDKNCPRVGNHESTGFFKKRENLDSNFEVRCCLIEHDFKSLPFKFNYFKDGYEKPKNQVGKKIFRDLTNIGQLLKASRTKKTRSCARFSLPTFYHQGVHGIEKPLWKHFTVSRWSTGFKEQRCALNQDDKTAKDVKGEKDNSENKDIENNSGSGESEEHNFCSGHGNGSQEDNNENDDNKKNEKTENDLEDRKNEEEEEEDDDDDDVEDPEEEKSKEIHCKVKNNSVENPDKESFRKGQKRKKQKGYEKDGNELMSQNEDFGDEKKKKRLKRSKTKAKKFLMENEGKNLKLKNVDNIQIAELDTEQSKNLFEFTNSLIESEVPLDEKMVEVEVILEENIDRNICLHNTYNTKNVRKSMGSSTTEEIEVIEQRIRKRSVSNQIIEPSDEERVKQFLLNSPSSISITPPKKLSLSNPPSHSVLKALATLKGLKGISTTIVKRKPKIEDDVMVIAERKRKQTTFDSDKVQNNANDGNSDKNRNKSYLPPIENLKTVNSIIPKIVTVQGNVSNFDDASSFKCESSRNDNPESDSSTIKISNVWGSFTNNIVRSNENDISCHDSTTKGSSFRQDFEDGIEVGKKKDIKKPVEYVVLD